MSYWRPLCIKIALMFFQIVGTILTWFFMGTLVVQTCRRLCFLEKMNWTNSRIAVFYYMNARKDPIAIKLLGMWHYGKDGSHLTVRISIWRGDCGLASVHLHDERNMVLHHSKLEQQ